MMSSKAQRQYAPEAVMVGQDESWIRKAVIGAALGTLLIVAPLAGNAATVPPAGFSEASIPFADHNGVRDWRADGSKGMWILAANGGWYYASFSSQCTTLPVVIGISFVPDWNGALSRWSSIRLDHNDRCFFRSLQPSDAPPKKGETDKPAASPGTTAKAVLGSNPRQQASLRLDSPGEVALPEVVVEAKSTTGLPSDSSAPACGLAGLTESIAHPVVAWRVIAPVPQDSDPDACLRATAYLNRVPDALASVRWYQ
jgi:hypothetical protein